MEVRIDVQTVKVIQMSAREYLKTIGLNVNIDLKVSHQALEEVVAMAEDNLKSYEQADWALAITESDNEYLALVRDASNMYKLYELGKDYGDGIK